MVRDPEKYLRDYKVGTSSRSSYYDTVQTLQSIFKTTIIQAAQVYFMGDGAYDNLGLNVGEGVQNFVSLSLKMIGPMLPSYNGFTSVSVTAGPTFASTKSTKFQNLDSATKESSKW